MLVAARDSRFNCVVLCTGQDTPQGDTHTRNTHTHKPNMAYSSWPVFIHKLCLAGKTENQAEQLQNLVRDNFPLFVRCAEGFEEFRTNSETEVGLGVNERIEKLEAIAESAAYQAKKSFKPLLDNTSEVRKVQSALAVLQRVAPILQVPALMRQHIENRRYSQALKTYRRVLVVDDSCNISLLTHVKLQAEECVRDARRDLEQRLTQDKASLEDLLNGIRDLGELLELEVPTLEKKKTRSVKGEDQDEDEAGDRGIYEVDGTVVNIRDHPPALACLLLQAAHFAMASKDLIVNAEDTAQRIYAGESLSSVQTNEKKAPENNEGEAMLSPNVTRGSGNQWKYDVLDARVFTTIKAVDIARSWLPRLVRVGKAAREEEKRRAARIGHRSRSSMKENHLTAFEVFVVNVAPSLTRLVEHAAFCSLGSNTRTGAKYIEMSFGQNSDDKLRTLLRSPLPPSQSTKVGKELASLVELLEECSSGVDDLRPDSALLQLSPLDVCKSLGDSAVVTIEKRRCIYAFDVCSRACSNRASGSGKFDADALLNCLQNLAEQLSRPEECSNEVEKGCELVVRRCCEGLASYVRDRGDDARLSAVAECADVMAERVEEVMREASALTPNTEAVQEVVMEDILGLESAMFDEYLESIRQYVANSVRVGWLDKDATEGAAGDGDSNLPPSFPSYLSASLLAIVRCRAQVEQALGDRIRRADSVAYQHLSMATVADGVVEGICNEVMKRKLKLKVRQADRLANELEFLNNTLKKFLGEETLALLDSTLHMVSSKAGRGRDYQGDGPDGLAALEELERLGRVYVLCLGDY
jgi:Exocyst complex component Sec5